MTSGSAAADREALREYVLTADDEAKYFERAFECVDRNGRRNLYDLGRLMVLQGYRPEELMALRKEHVNLEASQIRIDGGKTRAARRTLDFALNPLKFSRRGCRAIRHGCFRRIAAPGRPIGKLQGPHDKVCRETGLSFVIYGFRHTFATRLVESGL